MRCENIKRRIDSGEALDAAMKSHVGACPECRRACEAAGKMDELFAAAGKDSPDISLAAMRQRVEAGRPRRERRFGFGRRPRLVTAFGAVAALVLFAVLVPLPYTQVDGYEIVYAGSTGDIDVNLVSAAIAAIGCEDLSVRTDASRDEMVIAGLSSRNDAASMAHIVAQLTGSDRDPAVEPVRKKVTKPIIIRLAESIDDADDSSRVIIIRADNGALFLEGSAVKDAFRAGDISDSVILIRLESLMNDAGAEARDINMVIDVDSSGTYHMIKLRRAADSGADDDDGVWSVPADSQEIRLYFRRGDGDEGTIELETSAVRKAYEISVKAKKDSP